AGARHAIAATKPSSMSSPPPRTRVQRSASIFLPNGQIRAVKRALCWSSMPLEGHYTTVNTPLRKLTARERNVVVAGLVVTVIAVLALLFVPSHNESPLLDEHGGAHAGCIEVAVAGRVGAEPIVGCGAKAEQICRRAAGYDVPRSETITAACTEAGVRF